MAQPLFFSGKSLQQALLAAARHFRLDVEEIAYRQREQRQGVVRGRERVVVEVDPDAPRRPAAATATAAAPMAPVVKATTTPSPALMVPPRRDQAVPHRHSEPPRRPADLAPARGAEAEAVQLALEHLARLAGIQMEAQVLAGPESLWVDLKETGDGAGRAERAELVEAVAHLLPRTSRGLFGSAVSMRVDSGGVREQILEALRNSALAAAARVRLTGVAETLDEMNPAERRIVHMAIADDPALTTESLGNGVIKRIRIRPR